MAKLKKEDVLDYLETASMLEVSELITDIEEKFGVSAAAPVAVAAAPAAGGDGGAVEAKSEFDIELTGVGEKKINVIKVIREVTYLITEPRFNAQALSVIKLISQKNPSLEVEVELKEER